MKPTVDKVKAIAEFFHRSTAATQKLKSTQRQMSMVELKLKQECVTRWNSTFHMIQDAVIGTLAVINAPVVPLSQEEWEALQEACSVLEPFDQVTVEISAERYVTASKMLILCRGLQRVTAEHQSRVTTESVKELVNSLCSSMDKKFHRMEYNTILSETTILDPRFKKVAFNDNRAVDEALQRITTAALRYGQSSHLQGGHGGEEGAAARELEEPQASAVRRFFEERASRDTANRNPTADAILEVRSYLEEPLFQRSADPLSWWETRALIYPHLSHVMARRLCIVATSVPSETIFSKTGQIITERRNRISPAKLRHLVFLNANLMFSKQPSPYSAQSPVRVKCVAKYTATRAEIFEVVEGVVVMKSVRLVAACALFDGESCAVDHLKGNDCSRLEEGQSYYIKNYNVTGRYGQKKLFFRPSTVVFKTSTVDVCSALDISCRHAVCLPSKPYQESDSADGYCTVEGDVIRLSTTRLQDMKNGPVPVQFVILQSGGSQTEVALWREAALSDVALGEQRQITHLRLQRQGKLNSTSYTEVKKTEIAKTFVEVEIVGVSEKTKNPRNGSLNCFNGAVDRSCGRIVVIVTVTEDVFKSDIAILCAFIVACEGTGHTFKLTNSLGAEGTDRLPLSSILIYPFSSRVCEPLESKLNLQHFPPLDHLTGSPHRCCSVGVYKLISDRSRCHCVVQVQVGGFQRCREKVKPQQPRAARPQPGSDSQVVVAPISAHVTAVMASHAQDDFGYEEFSRGVQCTCNSLVFLAVLGENDRLTGLDLDRVLVKGDALYTRVKRALLNEGRY
ncbi:hypothetical protein MHYP_G00216330 [Metynnis hypsauchen]